MNQTPQMLEEYLSYSPRKAIKAAAATPYKAFINLGQKTAFDTFKLAASEVPAYKDFLKKHKIDPEKIKIYEDLLAVPITNKENYLSHYPLESLLISGSFKGKFAFTASSGSAGRPYYWPRFIAQDFGSAKGFETTLVSLFNIDKVPTLHLNCSGMGVWAAGDIVALLNKLISIKYPHNSSISPGLDLDSTINILCDVAPCFKQVVIYGYPPFLKDIVDNLPKQAPKEKLNFLTFGEAFSEAWRNYISQKIETNEPYRRIASVLGSSEGGFLGAEGANCVIIRQEAYQNPDLCLSLFSEKSVPSLIQYGPQSRYIEVIGSELILYNKGGLPLVRYDTQDYGGQMSADDIDQIFREKTGNSYNVLLSKLAVSNSKMPFVYLFGRSDYSVTIYGVIIAPETIKEVIHGNSSLDFLSGKFTLKTIVDKQQNQGLEIICELKKDIAPAALKTPDLSQIFMRAMTEIISEYRKLANAMGQRVAPIITLKEYGNKQYFGTKNKQKYILK